MPGIGGAAILMIENRRTRYPAARLYAEGRLRTTAGETIFPSWTEKQSPRASLVRKVGRVVATADNRVALAVDYLDWVDGDAISLFARRRTASMPLPPPGSRSISAARPCPRTPSSTDASPGSSASRAPTSADRREKRRRLPPVPRSGLRRPRLPRVRAGE